MVSEAKELSSDMKRNEGLNSAGLCSLTYRTVSLVALSVLLLINVVGLVQSSYQLEELTVEKILTTTRTSDKHG